MTVSFPSIIRLFTCQALLERNAMFYCLLVLTGDGEKMEQRIVTGIHHFVCIGKLRLENGITALIVSRDLPLTVQAKLDHL